MRTFGENIRNFAWTVDIVDDYTFDEVKRKIQEYLLEQSDITLIKLLIDQKVDFEPGLGTEWSVGGEKWSQQIKDKDGNYRGLAPYVYDTGMALWVTDAKQRHLRTGEDYIDSWSDTPPGDLPRYMSSAEIRTTIILPLRSEGKIFGVATFDSDKYLKFSYPAKKEFELLAETMQILYVLHKAHSTQQDSTKYALQQLKPPDQSAAFRLTGRTKPLLFFASAKQADDEVIGNIKEVLGQFSNHIDTFHWQSRSESGSIRRQIIRTIRKCTYGICYFSEPQDGQQGSGYRDNPNVLIEAGMLHALVNCYGQSPRAWIPIRERQSKDLPFNLKSERTLMIERETNGQINTHKLKAELKKRLRSFLADLAGD